MVYLCSLLFCYFYFYYSYCILIIFIIIIIIFIIIIVVIIIVVVFKKLIFFSQECLGISLSEPIEKLKEKIGKSYGISTNKFRWYRIPAKGNYSVYYLPDKGKTGNTHIYLEKDQNLNIFKKKNPHFSSPFLSPFPPSPSFPPSLYLSFPSPLLFSPLFPPLPPASTVGDCHLGDGTIIELELTTRVQLGLVSGFPEQEEQSFETDLRPITMSLLQIALHSLGLQVWGGRGRERKIRGKDEKK